MGCLVHRTKQTSKGAAVGIYLFIVLRSRSCRFLGLPPENSHENQNSCRVGFDLYQLALTLPWLCSLPSLPRSPEWGAPLVLRLINFCRASDLFLPRNLADRWRRLTSSLPRPTPTAPLLWRAAATMPYLSAKEVENEYRLWVLRPRPLRRRTPDERGHLVLVCRGWSSLQSVLKRRPCQPHRGRLSH